MNEKTINEKTVRKAMIDMDESLTSIAQRLNKKVPNVHKVLIGQRSTPEVIKEFNRIVQLSKSMRKAS